jgi:hypothetical protein
VQAQHARREVPDRDVEQARLDPEELADGARVHSGYQRGDLGSSFASELLQSGLDSAGIAVEALALGLNQLGQDGPDVVVHGDLILVSVRVRRSAPAKMVSC